MSNHGMQRYLQAEPDYSTPLTLIETHPEFALSASSIEWGLEAINGAQLDPAYELLSAYMSEQHTPQAASIAIKLADHYASIVRAHWHEFAEKMIENKEV